MKIPKLPKKKEPEVPKVHVYVREPKKLLHVSLTLEVDPKDTPEEIADELRQYYGEDLIKLVAEEADVK